MTIQPLKIPPRSFGQPIPVAPDTNAEVEKINELVAAVNAGLTTSNAIVGGDKYVQYLSSQTYGVPADALTIDRLNAETVLPGTTCTVVNPHPTPLLDTAASTYYRATIVPVGTAGAVLVPAFTGSADKVPIVWVEIVSNDSFTPLLASELNLGKDAYAGLDLRPLLIALVNGMGTGSTTVVTTPATQAQATGPAVTGFLPASAAEGASVTLTGTGFTKATAVLFNGTPASFQLINATTLVAVVPVGATTGPVAVTNSAGTGTSAASFTVSTLVVVTPPPAATKATKPTFGAIDDINNVVTLSSQYAYTEVEWGVEGQGPQALASNSICSPGNISGRLFAYVIADPAASPPRLQSDTVYSQPFSVAATANNAPTATISVVGGSSSVAPGQSVTLQLDGQDGDAGDSVVKLELLDNGVKISGAEIAGASGMIQSPALTAGPHSFTARATDSKGATGLSQAVVVTAQVPGSETVLTVTPSTLSYSNRSKINNGGVEYFSNAKFSVVVRNTASVTLKLRGYNITGFNMGMGSMWVNNQPFKVLDTFPSGGAGDRTVVVSGLPNTGADMLLDFYIASTANVNSLDADDSYISLMSLSIPAGGSGSIVAPVKQTGELIYTLTDSRGVQGGHFESGSSWPRELNRLRPTADVYAAGAAGASQARTIDTNAKCDTIIDNFIALQPSTYKTPIFIWSSMTNEYGFGAYTPDELKPIWANFAQRLLQRVPNVRLYFETAAARSSEGPNGRGYPLFAYRDAMVSMVNTLNDSRVRIADGLVLSDSKYLIDGVHQSIAGDVNTASNWNTFLNQTTSSTGTLTQVSIKQEGAKTIASTDATQAVRYRVDGGAWQASGVFMYLSAGPHVFDAELTASPFTRVSTNYASRKVLYGTSSEVKLGGANWVNSNQPVPATAPWYVGSATDANYIEFAFTGQFILWQNRQENIANVGISIDSGPVQVVNISGPGINYDVVAAYTSPEFSDGATRIARITRAGSVSMNFFYAELFGPAAGTPAPATLQFVNGEFDSPAVTDPGKGWVAGANTAIANGRASFTNASGAYMQEAGQMIQDISGLITGAQYDISFAILNISSGEISLLSDNNVAQFASGLGDATTTPGVLKKRFTASGSTDRLYLRGVNGATGDVDYVRIEPA
jgi:hypothetical protein